MILFGYKTKFSSILRALSAIGIGLVMLLRTDASVVVVRIIAVLLVVAGIVSFIHGYVKRKEGALPLMSVNAGVDILLGLVLFFWPGAVAGFIIAAIGVVPETGLLKGKVDTCNQGFIATDEYMMTSIPGVFAAGDVVQKVLRQIITAAADGAVAVTGVLRYFDL